MQVVLAFYGTTLDALLIGVMSIRILRNLLWIAGMSQTVRPI
jgi:hypothetical protein